MKPRFFATPARWRAWLEAHHADSADLLVGFYKTSTGKPSITWPESVDEALCFGWIDGKRQSLGDDTYAIRFTPRRPTSVWSWINVAKMAALREAGKMRPAGEAAFALRTDARTGVSSFDRATAAVLTPAQEQRLRKHEAAATYFDAQAPWYRRTAIHWVISARQDATRERRLDQLIAACAKGEAIKPLQRSRR